MLRGIVLLRCGRAGGQGIAGAEGSPCRLDRKSLVLDCHLVTEDWATLYRDRRDFSIFYFRTSIDRGSYLPLIFCGSCAVEELFRELVSSSATENGPSEVV